MLLKEIARTSAEIAATPARLGKIERLGEALRRVRPEEVLVAVAYLSGELPQGTIGVGWATLRDLPPAAPSASREVADLFGRATGDERRFLFGLLSGELRQGALEGVMVEAVARAAEVPAGEVRRALMLAGSLGAVAAAAMADGRGGLAGFRLTVLRPVQPMLAQTAADIEEALGRIRPAAVEWKLDGARLQVHRLGPEVRAFTRNLAEVTSRVPEVAASVLALPVESVVLDGEAIALRPDGRPHPFQVTMSRFGSRLDVEQLRTTTPLSALYFDCLHMDGEDLIDRPLSERAAAMASRLPEAVRVPRRVVEDDAEGASFLEAALQRGHEGVMVKALDAPYEAGRRGATWLKVKRAHTLDLVVLAAEWGHGRRKGWLSNLHLGARDPE